MDMDTDKKKKVFKDIITHYIEKKDFDQALTEITTRLKSDTEEDYVCLYTTELARVLDAQPENSASMKTVLDLLQELVYAWSRARDYTRAFKLTEINCVRMENFLLELRLFIFSHQENTAEMKTIMKKFSGEHIPPQCPETCYIFGTYMLRMEKYNAALHFAKKGVEKVKKEDDEDLFKRLIYLIEEIKSGRNALQLIREVEEEREQRAKEEKEKREKEKKRREEVEEKRREELTPLQQNEMKKAVDGGEEDEGASDIVDEELLPGGLHGKLPEPGADKEDDILTSLLSGSYLSDNLVDPSEYTALRWHSSVNAHAQGFVVDKAWEAFQSRFKAWEATLNSNEQDAIRVFDNTERKIVFGMKRLSDAAPESFVVIKECQGYEIRYFTSEGVNLVKGLLLWMNNHIHEFNILPDLAIESVKQHIYYDDSRVVVNLPRKVAIEKSIGIKMYTGYFEDSIRMLVNLILDFCGGAMNRKVMPVMIFHLFKVMEKLDSWVNNFEFIKNHPVLWTASELDVFCQRAKNVLRRMDRHPFIQFCDVVGIMAYTHKYWLSYVSKYLNVLSESSLFEAVLVESLSMKSREHVTKLPIGDNDALRLGYFAEPIGILYWTRELFSHLSHEEDVLIIDSLMLLFPVYFCQVAWTLFKSGLRSWIVGVEDSEDIVLKSSPATK